MNMYNDFASSYDQIFPADPETTAFLHSVFPRGARLMDVGCGTGAYAEAMGEKGHIVVGVEPNPEMLAIANNRHRRPNVTFGPQGIEDLGDEETFEGLYCIGNVLVHLPTQKAVLEGLKRMWTAIKPGGTLVVQIVNYDRVIDQNITSLPTIQGDDGSSLERTYDHRRDKIVFTTLLRTPKREYRGSVNLLPLRARKLEALMKTAGFDKIRFFDGFSKKPFSPQSSFALVATAEK
ncbi:MAG TPA: class I SAM-dependent methyltransferase [Candidatus Izemoplasmatales bacterium]|nr:class I SAM-dependent methyltransferase [Bacillota bacterium]HRY77497.1 class I SAM-dependent methyltransferase [Candidatus Izemoplasmatales bacterium]